MNVVEARVDGATLRFGQFSLPLDDAQRTRVGDRTSVVVGIRPEVFGLASDPAAGAPMKVEVSAVEALGTETHVFFGVDAPPVSSVAEAQRVDGEVELLPGGKVRFVARLGPDTQPRPGDFLELAVATGKLHFFDPRSGLALT